MADDTPSLFAELTTANYMSNEIMLPGMQLQLSEQQTMIRNMVRAFAEKDIAEIADKTDKTKTFPQETITKMAGLGLLGITVPTDYGGAGLDHLTSALVIEEISRRCASTGAITSVHNNLACYPLVTYGSEGQKKRYLPDLASGKKIGAFAASEANAGSDLSNMQTTATKTGAGYLLNGTKTFVTNGPQAGLILVFAKTDEDADKKGISCFIVTPEMEGCTSGDINDKLGLCGSTMCSIHLKDVSVPKENLLGAEGQGLEIALDAITTGRIGIAAQCTGIIDQSLEESIAYSQEREQFNRPISSFQAMKVLLANIATNLEAARYLTYHAAYQKDQGNNVIKAASMAKLFASEKCVDAALDAVQIHGGYGYTKEYTVERLYRDSKVTEIYEGTSDMQRLAIARELLR